MRTIYKLTRRAHVIPANAAMQSRLRFRLERSSRLLWFFLGATTQVARIVLLSLFLLARPSFAAAAPDLEEQTRAIATELRCVVCQNLSVADSPSEMAQQMRAIVREQLQAGKTPQQVKDFFVSKYGEWVLLKPATQGFSLLVWVMPFVALIIGLGLGIIFIRRWARNKVEEPKAMDPAVLARVRRESAAGELATVDLEDPSPRSALLKERNRLYADLAELEFDFEAGKLSEEDYTGLRRDIELKAATVLDGIDRMEAENARKKPAERAPHAARAGAVSREKGGMRGWRLAAGGAFLLLFGLILGVVLMNSLRPRGSEQDSITGDFLTGTSGSGNSEIAGLLQVGKDAFTQQEFPKAIETFKKVLAADPDQPEAHAYMGFILIQAGHADGALMAFEKALSVAPKFPMALWGKGMALYQGKQDYAGARETLEQLLKLVPAGAERNEIVKVLGEIPLSGPMPPQGAKFAAQGAIPSGQHISGIITIDPKLAANFASGATLFIIARAAGSSAGPPLAVKKLDGPTFPLSYTLGAENVMMQGRRFSGKVAITARLDKDGNPTTRGAGDLTGDYKKNPVDVGAKNVDIVLDQLAR